MRVLPSLVLAAAASTNQCSDNQQTAGNYYAQCVNRAPGVPNGNAAVAATVEAFVPTGAAVGCTDTASFALAGGEVQLVLVAYGNLQDCPAGCFSSEVCAIYDANGAALYSAAWWLGADRPVALPSGCPSSPDGSGDTRSCVPPPPGAQHPVTATDAFAAFKASGGSATGRDWHSCFL